MFNKNDISIQVLAEKLRAAIVSLEKYTARPVFQTNNLVSNFITEIRKAVNTAQAGTKEHQQAMEFALKACAILDNLVKQKPSQAELKIIKSRLENINKESPLSLIGRICIGIVAALLVPVMFILETIWNFIQLFGGPSSGKNYNLTNSLANTADSMFKAPPMNPVLKIVDDLCDSAQKILNADKQAADQVMANELRV